MVDACLRERLPSGLLFFRGASGNVAVDAEVLGNSEVLRKLSEDEDQVQLDDPLLLGACLRLAALPTTPSDLRSWLEASDLLCADPSPEALLAAVTRGLRPSLTAARTQLELAESIHPDVVPLDELIQTRVCLVKTLAESGGIVEAGPSPIPPPAKRQRLANDLAERPSAALAFRLWTPEAASGVEVLLEACEFAWDRASATERLSAPCHVHGVIRSALLGLADALETAPMAILQAERLLSFLSREEVRWLVHRAFTVMLSAEQRSEEFFLGADFAAALQRGYKSGLFDLGSLLPLPRRKAREGQWDRFSVFLSPGCAGRRETPVLQVGSIMARCRKRVPWLARLWELQKTRGRACFLAGSTLTAALLPTTARRVNPGDVDVFVEKREELADCLADLTCASTECGFEAEVATISASKFRVTLTRGEEEMGVDLYAHPLARVNVYHMSVVRCAFDGECLYCAPSAALALATTVSAEFTMNWKTDKAARVLLRKWRSGLCLLLNAGELRAFVAHLRERPELVADLAPALRRTVERLQAFPDEISLQRLRFNTRSSEAGQAHAGRYAEWRFRGAGAA